MGHKPIVLKAGILEVIHGTKIKLVGGTIGGWVAAWVEPDGVQLF